MDFFEAVSSLDTTREGLLIEITDGDHAGEKAIITSCELTWTDNDNGFISSHLEALVSLDQGLSDIGGVQVYIENIGHEKEIVICGAGHVAMQILKTAKMIGMRTVVIDDRLDFANDAIRAGADEVIFKPFAEALENIEGGGDTYFVIVTRGHRYDKECLRAVTSKPHAYIGMMGSRRRVDIVKEDLAAEGISGEILGSVHTPIGLDIRAETPEEIAISVMAEIISVKNRKTRSSGFTREILGAAIKKGRPAMVMATIINRQGSAPRGVGTRMLIAKDGSIIGTIGGGCIEGSVIAKGRRMLLDEEHRPVITEVDMTAEAAEDEGMVCGGRVKVLLEII